VPQPDRSKKRGSSEAQEAIRFKVLDAVKSKKLNMRQAADVFQVAYSAVRNWCKKARTQGKTALTAHKRGRKLGQCKKFSKVQENKVSRLIADKNPEQLKLPFILWERKAVQELIVGLYGIELPLSTIGHYLKQWGMSKQRPAKRFYQRNDKQAQDWKEKTYPALQTRAKKENAEIQWADESSVCNRSSSAAKGYAPKGKTPTLKENAIKQRIHYISSVTNQGKVRYMTYKGKFDSVVFLKFLERSIKGARKKIIMIVDNYRVHKSKKVEEWLKGKDEAIELHYLPPYCPDLNPDEYLNCDVKSNVHRQKAPRTSRELEQNTKAILRKIGRNPSRVKSYFEAASIAYAAA
jgi:transposase